ncbi:MAG: hypothetical protein KY475_10835 [Planctomycetes bacterium]|nr:hypothetical protein [Planctomycetota bacterium]
MNRRNPPAPRIYRQVWIPATALIVGMLAAGCESRTATRPTRRPAVSATAADQDHLAIALETLKQFFESDPDESQRQVLYHLNRWIDAQPPDDSWKRDPQIDRLPRWFREMPEMATLDDRVFLTDDVRYLTEAYILRSIGQWVSDDASRRWMEAKQEAAGADALVLDAALDTHEFRLEVAKALFDWTVRHIQLDTLLAYPQAKSAGVGGAAVDALSPPEQGIPGPGYRYYPRQILMFGTGDAWQRARIFLLLLRQRGFDAAMLAVDDRGPGSRANLWCPAVLIDDKLYLFDTALGLPIPGEEAGSVATLSEVLANPDLLRNLDVDDGGETLAYPVSADDLKRVAALVDAETPALSRRMHMLESRLVGENELALAVSPTAIGQRLREGTGLTGIGVRLWRVPLETQMYREALQRLARRDPEIQRRLLQEQGVLAPTILRARLLHFLGRIEGDEHEPGAIGFYLETRKADQWIDALQTSPEAWAQIGLPPLPPELTPQQQQMARAIQQSQLRLNKQHAGYWLGLAQYDIGQHQTAINWLKDRTLDAYADGVWTGGARYNLGRTYEALGRIEDARRLYFQSEPPHRHGNLLRARLLREAGK